MVGWLSWREDVAAEQDRMKAGCVSLSGDPAWRYTVFVDRTGQGCLAVADDEGDLALVRLTAAEASEIGSRLLDLATVLELAPQ